LGAVRGRWAASRSRIPTTQAKTAPLCARHHFYKTAGAWQQIHDIPRDLVRVHHGRDPLPTTAIIDSQSVRGADTVPAATRGYDAGKKINGRKRHIAVDTGGLLLTVVVTLAGIQDRDAAHRLLTTLTSKFSTIRPATTLGRGTHLRLDQQTPPLRTRLRKPPHPPRSRDPHSHDPDYVTTAGTHRRMVITVSKCSLR
jgi:hypothetical protein